MKTERCPECLSDSHKHGNMRPCTNDFHAESVSPAPQREDHIIELPQMHEYKGEKIAAPQEVTLYEFDPTYPVQCYEEADGDYVLHSDYVSLREELTTAKQAIEHDRSIIAGGVSAMKKVLDGRSWLTEGRGPYEWDDDRWHSEFLAAGNEMLAAMEPLKRLAADLSNSPTDAASVIAARIDLSRQVADMRKALEAARKQRDWLIARCGEIGVTVNVSIGAPITEAYQLVNDRANEAIKLIDEAAHECWKNISHEEYMNRIENAAQYDILRGEFKRVSAKLRNLGAVKS